ncbi:hypothetical protein BUALT_Bualt05G0076000 [Buddleja alternifolia]|uniref:Uncharacterized protein n=1 Tax=Buddleja alternifolia TaxID=168488 RepID=A0AAV6XPD7_9LAMI|nr:hypothetical protein BUALT_Bualt05G0076000 [Buddleja alternifolia]
MSTDCQGKSSWPELLGAPGDLAVVTIERENPLVTANIAPPGSNVTTDVRCDRVRVYVDAHGNVDRIPTIARKFIRKINCVGIYVGKSSWPELLGAPGDLAVVTIERENPLVTANIVPPGSNVTTDVRCDRVRVYVDAHGNVDRIPTIG